MPKPDLTTFCAEHEDDIEELAQRFSDYQPLSGMSQHHIAGWLSQFSRQHWSLALELANIVQYYGTRALNGAVRALKDNIEQQIKTEGVLHNRVFYVPGGRTAESGQGIAQLYRNVNRLRRRRSQFVDLLELQERLFKLENAMVVFLDDFIGTGQQMSNYWRDVISQYVPEYLPLYLAVAAAFPEGVRRIENETPFTVLIAHPLSSRHQLLGERNTRFTTFQKRTLRRYCEKWENRPLGFGGIGALVSFLHGTPNNAPSVIRGSRRQRPNRGLLPGWDDLS